MKSSASSLLHAGLIAIGVVLLMVFFLSGNRSPRVELRKYAAVPAFSLVERSGRTVTNNDLKGKIWVADFVFTTCPGPCPIISANMAHLQTELAGDPRVQLVSFTVDPQDDTPAVLSAYANNLGADPQRWWFLTGPEKQLYDLIQKGFFQAVQDNHGKELEAGQFLITHSTRVVLVDDAGFMRDSLMGLPRKAASPCWLLFTNWSMNEVKTTQRHPRKSVSVVRNEDVGMTPVERWMIIGGIALALILAVGFGLFQFAFARYQAIPEPESLVIKPDYPRHLIDFSLTDQTGQRVTRADLNGKIVVVNFVFTSCTLVCFSVNAQMAKIQSRTSPSDVRLISLILNPDDNSVSALSQYSQAYRPVPGHWSFLTGDEASIHRLIGTSFLSKDTTGQFSYMPGNFAHAQRIALLDRKGHLVNYFDGLNQNAAAAVLDEIKNLQNHD